MIEDHKHCIMCGRAVGPDRSTCSPECEEALRKHQKRISLMRTLTMIGLMALIFLTLMLSR